MAECPRCGTSTNEDASECPSCGQKFVRRELSGSASSGGRGFPVVYFDTLREVLTGPTQFFRKMPLTGGLAWPLAFALITHWIGSAIGYVWRTLAGGAVSSWLSGFFRMMGDVADVDEPGRGAAFEAFKNRAVEWLWGAGPVIIDPFLTLLSILFTSFLVFVGARLLVSPGRNGAPKEITYESAVRVVCFGMTPAILAALPLFGGVVASICVAIVTVIGAREVYRVSSGRAMVVGLFPKVLFLGIILLGMTFFALVFLKLVTSSF